MLVSVTNDVVPAFESTLPELPPFRAVVHATASESGTEAIKNAGQAADAAFEIRNAIKTAVNSYPEIKRVHLFMAVPAGLGLMIGQLVNVPVKFQTYDLEESDSGRRYRAAVGLSPYQY